MLDGLKVDWVMMYLYNQLDVKFTELAISVRTLKTLPTS